MLRGGSTRKTCRTEGAKSSPRERRDVVRRTWGEGEGLTLCFSVGGVSFSGDEDEEGEEGEVGMGLRNPARCLFEPRVRAGPPPVSATLSMPFSRR